MTELSNTVRFEESAILFETLAEKIYTSPQISTIREIIANALDIHRVTSQSRKPLVTIEHSKDILYKISVRDFGTGIRNEEYSDAFTFFKSTKNTVDAVSGAFGLGIKSPYGLIYQSIRTGYSDITNFFINSYIDGVQSSYVHYINDSSIPQWDKLYDVNSTEENGLEVIFFVKAERGVPLVDDQLLRIAFGDKIELVVNGKPQDISSGSLSEPFMRFNNVEDGIDLIVYRHSYDRISGVLYRKGDIVYRPHDSNGYISVNSNITFIVDVDTYGLQHTIGSSRESISLSFDMQAIAERLITEAYEQKVLPNRFGLVFFDRITEEAKKLPDSSEAVNFIMTSLRTIPYDYIADSEKKADKSLYPIVTKDDKGILTCFEDKYPFVEFNEKNKPIKSKCSLAGAINDGYAFMVVDNTRYNKQALQLTKTLDTTRVFLLDERDTDVRKLLEICNVKYFYSSQVTIEKTVKKAVIDNTVYASRLYEGMTFRASKFDIEKFCEEKSCDVYYLDDVMRTGYCHMSYNYDNEYGIQKIGFTDTQFYNNTFQVTYRLECGAEVTKLIKGIVLSLKSTTSDSTKSNIDMLVEKGIIKLTKDIVVSNEDVEYLTPKETLLSLIVDPDNKIFKGIKNKIGNDNLATIFGVEYERVKELHSSASMIPDILYKNSITEVIRNLNKTNSLESEIYGETYSFTNTPHMLKHMIDYMACKVDMFGLHDIIKEYIDKTM